MRKITRETLQQIIKEEVAKEVNEAYRRDVDVGLTEMINIAESMGLSRYEGLMDDLMAIKLRYGGMKPSGKPVGDVDMSKMDI